MVDASSSAQANVVRRPRTWFDRPVFACGFVVSMFALLIAGCAQPPLPPGAVATWSFDDLTNPTADGTDGHSATLFGGATFVTNNLPPVAGDVAAVHFDGTGYGEVPDPGGAGNLDGFSGLTLSAWVNPDRVDIVDGGQMIIGKYHSAPPLNTISYWLLLRGNQIEIFVSRTREINEARMTSVGADLVPGAWVHVAGTWDGTQFRLYLNGKEVAGETLVGGTFPATMDDSSVPVTIGCAESFISGERASFFHGFVDNAYVFNRALAPSEIPALMDHV